MFDYFWHKTLGRPYRLQIQETGRADGPVLVMLHGIAASSDDWRLMLPYLEEDYRCIRIDLLGFGTSPKPQWNDYTMLDHTRALYHTLNKLGLRQRFTLIGHSLGGLLAVQYTKEHHPNLERLILLSPPVYPPLQDITSPATRQLTGLLLGMYRLLSGNKISPRTFKRLSRITPLPKSVIINPATWLPFQRTLQNCIETQTVLSDIRQLTLPISVLYGTLDQVVLRKNVELLASQPNVSVQSFTGGHDLTRRYGRMLADVLARTAKTRH